MIWSPGFSPSVTTQLLSSDVRTVSGRAATVPFSTTQAEGAPFASRITAAMGTR